MKNITALFKAFNSIIYLGNRYLVLSILSCIIAMLWSVSVMFYYHQFSSGAVADVGFTTSKFSLLICPAILLIGFYQTFTKSLAHLFYRRVLKTGLFICFSLLFFYGLAVVFEVLTSHPNTHWQPYVSTLPMPLLMGVIVPFAIIILIPYSYYHLSKLADFRFFRRRKHGLGGASRWASVGTYYDKAPAVIAGTGGMMKDLPLGSTRYLDDPMVRRVAIKSTEDHLLGLAGTGSGKSTTLLYSIVATHFASMICNDPKGEFARNFFNKRDKKQGKFKGVAYMLDPEGVNAHLDIPAGCYNPLSEIDINDPKAETYVKAIAEACVVSSPNDKKHFIETPRIILAGIIAFVLKTYPKPFHNLPFCVDLLFGVEQIDENTRALNPELVDEVLLEMTQCDAAGMLPMKAAYVLKKIGNNEGGSMISTLVRSVDWITSPLMREHLQGESSFKFSDIGVDGFHTTVFVVFPFVKGENNRWVRVLFNMGINLMRERLEQPEVSTALVLDEMGSLGEIKIIKDGITTLRDKKQRIITSMQNISQLQQNFGREWTNFVANSVTLGFGIHDSDTAEWLSKMVGKHMVDGTLRDLMSSSDMIINLSKTSNRMVVIPTAASKGRDNLPMLLERRSFKYYENDFRHYKDFDISEAKVKGASQEVSSVHSRFFFSPASKFLAHIFMRKSGAD